MTNRMILQDPMVGNPPVGSRGWTGLQRQLAEDTAPGFTSRVLLTNYTVADDASWHTPTNFQMPVKANVKYYFELWCAFHQADTKGLQIQWNMASGTAVGHPEDTSRATYKDKAGAAFRVYTNVNPGTAQTCETTNTVGYTMEWQGWVNVTVAGVWQPEFQRGAAGATTTLYSGSRVIMQPIVNLAEQSNP